MSRLIEQLHTIARSHFNQPWSAAMKLLGFVIGFVGCILILTFVNYESSYDAWLSNADRLARVIQIRDVSTGAHSVSPPYPLADAARTDLPGVVSSARMQPLRVMLQQGQARFNEVALFVDPSFLSLFDVHIVSGDPKPLERPYSVVLSRRAAAKYFGREDVIGNRLLLGGKHEVTVTGVMSDWRTDSHLSPDVLLPLETFLQIAKEDGGVDRERLTGWDNCQCYPTYLLLDRPRRFDEVDAGLHNLLVHRQGEEYANRLPLSLQHVRDAYLGSTDYRTYLDHAKKGNPVQLLVFIAIAFVLLVISSVNFANFSVAEATKRAKEIGMRRILGASRGAVAGRLIAEAGLLAIVALAVSYGLAYFLLDAFAGFLGRPIATSALLSPAVLTQIIVAATLSTLVAGSVSALLLARASPIALLRESASFEGKLLSGGRLRQLMVMLQILISTVLIIGSIAIYAQLAYVRDVPRGYSDDGKLVVNGEGSHEAFGEISARLAALPTVTGVSIANALPTTAIPSPRQLLRQGGSPADARSVVVIDTDFGLLPALRIKLMAGRLFDPQFGADSFRAPEDGVAADANVVINRAAALELGFGSPESAIGRVVRAEDSDQANLAMHVVGVVEDIRYGNPKEAIQPMLYRARTDWQVNRHEPRYFMVSSTDPSSPALQEAISKLWLDLVPGFVSDASSMSSRRFAQLAGEEEQFHIVFMFTVAALFVSVLGVLGLAAFVMRRRAKELSMHRVLGASKLQVAQLVSYQQMRPILLAVVLSFPCVYWLIQRWLENFDLRVPLSWTWFLAGAVISSTSAFLLLLLFTLRVTGATSPVRYLKGG